MGGPRSISEPDRDGPQRKLVPEWHPAQPVGRPGSIPYAAGQNASHLLAAASFLKGSLKPQGSIRLDPCIQSLCLELGSGPKDHNTQVARVVETWCLWLQTLNLSNTGLTADLPALWGVNGSFPSLTTVDVSRNIISGGHSVLSWNLARNHLDIYQQRAAIVRQARV